MLKTDSSSLYRKIAYVLICVICIGHLLYIGKEVFAPLLFSFLFAIILLPLTRFMELRLKFPRILSSFLSVLLLITTILSVFFLIGTQISSFSDDIPTLRTHLVAFMNDAQLWFQQHFNINLQKQKLFINRAANGMMSTSTAIVGITVLSISSVVIFMVFINIYTFFLLFYRRHLLNFLLIVFDKAHEVIIHEVACEVQYVIKSFVLGLFFEMCTVIFLTFAALLIIGAKYALLLSLIVGFFNIVPYIGIFTALLLSFLITFATSGINQALFVGLFIFIIHVLDSNILMPRIVGGKVKINALITIIAVVTGGMIWGIVGMFLCVPFIAILKIIFDRVEILKPWGLLLGDAEK